MYMGIRNAVFMYLYGMNLPKLNKTMSHVIFIEPNNIGDACILIIRFSISIVI